MNTESCEKTNPEIQANDEQIMGSIKKLADHVKACVSEGQSCESLGSEFNNVAGELNIPFAEVIDKVFGIVSGDATLLTIPEANIKP